MNGLIGWSFVSTATPSPFAANITFDQINRYMYADDSPDAAGPSSLSERLIADVLANEQLRPRISLTTVGRFEEKRQRRHPDYQPQALSDWQEWVKERLLVPEAEHQGPDEGLVYSVVTLARKPGNATANLYAPLVINTSNMRGSQIIMFDSEYSVNQPLMKN